VSNRFCPGCGAPLRVDQVAIDILPDIAPARSWGARAMQSKWLARIYNRWWRPAAFALSTGLQMPPLKSEIPFVLSKLLGTPGPWLDVSCGPATFTRALVANSNGRAVVGVDLSRAMLERARAAAPDAVLVRADAAALPFASGTFGGVVNLAALDLYPGAARVIAECARVLAPGGRWVCSTLVGAGRTRFPPALAALAGVRTVTLDELILSATRAGLDRTETAHFGRYVVAWADKT
jgi:SAM-dependent methyltransferase